MPLYNLDVLSRKEINVHNALVSCGVITLRDIKCHFSLTHPVWALSVDLETLSSIVFLGVGTRLLFFESDLGLFEFAWRARHTA